MKLRHKSFATTTLWGKAQEGSRTAIKAIKKRLRSLVVERERDPLPPAVGQRGSSSFTALLQKPGNIPLVKGNQLNE